MEVESRPPRALGIDFTKFDGHLARFLSKLNHARVAPLVPSTPKDARILSSICHDNSPLVDYNIRLYLHAISSPCVRMNFI
jgi:hypothetical protein